MHTIDLRSDTITRPTDAMREAISKAEVGDDVYQEDPSINRLQQAAAEITGKEAALFVSSGSMGNLISLYIQGGRGNEVLTHRTSHIIEHELGSPAAIAGVLTIGLDGERGLLSAQEIERHLHPQDYTTCSTTLIELENTISGTCYPLEQLSEIRDVADRHDLKIHMDGARLFNAAVAQQVEVREICQYTDTLSFCLSKGLGAPVGSMLCGSEKFIAQAMKIRKMLGGGMRQAGFLAAAGIYALENHVERLSDDHRHAREIAEALSAAPWASIDPQQVETNIVVFKTVGTSPEQVVRALGDQGVICFDMGPDSIRMVTHLHINDKDTDQVCRVISGLSFQ
jgi:threonine aldolase